MPINYDVDFSEDILYKKSEEKGLEKGLRKGELLKETRLVERYLLEDKKSIKYIAASLEVTEAFVTSVKARLIA